MGPKWVPGWFTQRYVGERYQIRPIYAITHKVAIFHGALKGRPRNRQEFRYERNIVGYQSVLAPYYETVYVPGGWYEAEVEGSKYVTTPNPGWNSGAISIDWIKQPIIEPGGGKLPGYRFKVKRESLGVFVGLAVDSVGISTDHILNGIYLTQGQWRPVVNGQKIS